MVALETGVCDVLTLVCFEGDGGEETTDFARAQEYSRESFSLQVGFCEGGGVFECNAIPKNVVGRW